MYFQSNNTFNAGGVISVSREQISGFIGSHLAVEFYVDPSVHYD